MEVPTDEDMVEEAVRSMHWRAMDFMERGEWEKAEAIYRQWMDYLPWDARPKFALGQLLLARGEYGEGFELYEARADLPTKFLPKKVSPPPPE